MVIKNLQIVLSWNLELMYHCLSWMKANIHVPGYCCRIQSELVTSGPGERSRLDPAISVCLSTYLPWALLIWSIFYILWDVTVAKIEQGARGVECWHGHDVYAAIHLPYFHQKSIVAAFIWLCHNVPCQLKLPVIKRSLLCRLSWILRRKVE